MSWNKVTGATGYGLYVSEAPNWTLIYENESIGDVSSFRIPSGVLEAAKQYRWNMRAKNASGWGLIQTNRLYFQTEGPAPSIDNVSPTSMPASSSNITFTINGSDFVNGATLTFDPPNGSNISSSASKLTFNSPNKITYLFNNANDAGTWSVRVNNPDGQSSGWEDFIVASANQPPSRTGLNQYRADTNAVIPQGGTIPSGVAVVFKATVTDPDADTAKLEVEVRTAGGTFTGTPTHTGSLVTSGSVASVSVSGLAAGSYGYKARAVDSKGNAGVWSNAFNPDFIVASANQPPSRTGLNQYRADTNAVIPQGGTIPSGVAVVFKATVADPDADSAKLEVEVRTAGGTFTGTPTHSGSLVSSGSVASVSVSGLASGSYGYKARAVDSKGNAGVWSNAFNPDFIVASANQPPSRTGLNQYRADTNAVIPQGGTIPSGVAVAFKATVADPDADTVKLEVEVRTAGGTFTGTPTHSGSLVSSGSVASVSVSGLASGSYGYKARAVDSKGNAGVWSNAFNPDFILASANQPAPSITEVNLGESVTGSSTEKTIILRGSNFQNKPSVVLNWNLPPLPPSGGKILDNAQVTFVRDYEIRIAIRTGTDADTWTVKLINPDGQPSNVKSFQVIAPPTTITNRGPSGTSGNQFRSDTNEPIALNPPGSIPSGTTTFFQAKVSDPDSDAVQLEVELQKLPWGSTAPILLKSGVVASGSVAKTAVSPALASGDYGWRYRVKDANDAYSQWVPAGNPDFHVTGTRTNKLPVISGFVLHNQSGTAINPTNGVYPFPSGGGVYGRALASDGDGDPVTLELRLTPTQGGSGQPIIKRSEQSFTGGYLLTETASSLDFSTYRVDYRVVDNQPGSQMVWKIFGDLKVTGQSQNQSPKGSFSLFTASGRKLDVGKSLSVSPGESLILKGSATDPEGHQYRVKIAVSGGALASNFAAASYHGPSKLQVSGASTSLSFTAPSMPGSYWWGLVIEDEKGAGASNLQGLGVSGSSADFTVAAGLPDSSVSITRASILKNAREMINFSWTPLYPMHYWDGYVHRYYDTGKTYHSIPYLYGASADKNLFLNKGVPSYPSGGTVINDINDYHKSLPSDYPKGGTIEALFGSDCSAFLAWSWGWSKHNGGLGISGKLATGDIAKSSKVQKLTLDPSGVKPGDAMVKTGHVFLVEKVFKNQSDKWTIWTLEQTADITDNGNEKRNYQAGRGERDWQVALDQGYIPVRIVGVGEDFPADPGLSSSIEIGDLDGGQIGGSVARELNSTSLEKIKSFFLLRLINNDDENRLDSVQKSSHQLSFTAQSPQTVSRIVAVIGLVNWIENELGLKRPSSTAPQVSDLPSDLAGSEAVNAGFAWQILDDDDLVGGLFAPDVAVHENTFATWTMRATSMVVNPMVTVPTSQMSALASQGLMDSTEDGNEMISHHAARMLIKGYWEKMLHRKLSGAETEAISTVRPFEDRLAFGRSVKRSEFLEMLIGAMKGISKIPDPAVGNVPKIGDEWVSKSVTKNLKNAVAWQIVRTSDLANNRFLPDALVSRATAARWLLSARDVVIKPVANSPTGITTKGFIARWGGATGATGYILDVATDRGFTKLVTGLHNRSVGNVRSFAVSGLNPGTNYFYRVRSITPAQTSGNSATVSVITKCAAPVILEERNVGRKTFTARWKKTKGVEGYRIDVSTNRRFTKFVKGYKNKSVGNKQSAMIINLKAGTAYYFRVRAINASGASTNSKIGSTKTKRGTKSHSVAAVPTNDTQKNAAETGMRDAASLSDRFYAEWLSGVAKTTTNGTVSRVLFVGRKHLVMSISNPKIQSPGGILVEVSPDLINWYSGPRHTTVIVDSPSLLRVSDNSPITSDKKRYIRARSLKD